MIDEQAEDAAAVWEIADHRALLVVDADGDELREATFGRRVEHAERGVLGVGDGRRRRDDFAEHRRDIQLRPDGDHCLQ